MSSKDRKFKDYESSLLSSDDSHSEHVDEKWLISYADMMTLLFGLFVMLYSIAMETQGNPDKYFSDLTTEAEKQASVADENKDIKIAQLKKELDSASATLALKISELKSLKDQLTRADQNSKTISEDLSKIQQEKQSNQSAMSAMLAEIEKLRMDTEDLKNKISKLKKERKLASLAEIETNQIKKMSLSELENENKKLIAQLKILTEQAQESFVFISLSWATKKHDIDLEVTDPGGRIYNFKNRAYKDNSARFLLDSRTGPGMEVWQSTALIPGSYKINVSMYNNYGNTDQAKLRLAIYSRAGEINVPSFEIDFLKSKTKQFMLNIDKQGQITIN